MKKQEAIKMLTVKVECMRRETSGIDVDCNSRNCDNCELCYTQGTMGEQQEALTMAISALQAQDVPDTNVRDTISRQAAIDVIEAGRLTKLIDAETAVNGLKALPSAQSEQKQGKWIYHIDDLFPAESTMECDQCHAKQPLTCDDEYCPHCGARMGGGRNG